MGKVSSGAIIVFSTLVPLCRATGESQKPQKSTTTVTLAEPATYSLEKLYKSSDIVALVKILSGDTEHYEVAVYKGEVVEAFKGTSAKQILFFGPFVGQRLGSEYVLFLRKDKSQLSPKSPGQLSYGTVSFASIFDEGYTSMETRYECVFNRKEPRERCDYGVRVCTDYIKLPKSTPVYPPMTEVTDFGCRWVRKEGFLSLLRSFN